MNISIKEPLAEEMVQSIVGGLRCNARARYLLPFVCAKLFADVVLRESVGSAIREAVTCEPKFVEEIEKQLRKEHSSVDILRKHHRIKLVNEEIRQLTETHPLILFMQDISAFTFETENILLQMPEYMIQKQINTNWLALYLFGKEGYFDDPNFCSRYSELTLPILLRLLFRDEDNETGEHCDFNMKWLIRQANIENVELRRHKEYRDLYDMVSGTLDKIESSMVPDVREWKKELCRWIYNDKLWTIDGITDLEPPYQGVAQELRRLNANVKEFLRRKHVRKARCIPIIRHDCMRWLVDDILENIRDILERWSSLNEISTL